MQHVDVPAELKGHHRAVRLAVMPNGDFDDAAADSSERLGILRHPAYCMSWSSPPMPPKFSEEPSGNLGKIISIRQS
jgi:hypothetical protein